MTIDTQLNDSIANYMELLAKLAAELPEAITSLRDLAVDTLINGGKLVVITDLVSRSAGAQLCYVMNTSNKLERPPLQTINFNQLADLTPAVAENDLLRGVSKSRDLIIVFAEKLENITLDLVPEQSVVISAGIGTHATAPTLGLGIQQRGEWQLALTVIINTLADQIEVKLFG